MHAACIAATQRPHASRAVPLPTSHARLSTRQDAKAFNQPLSWDTSKVTTMRYMFWMNSLSDANKLFIRCAWAGTSVFNRNARPGNHDWPVCTSG